MYTLKANREERHQEINEAIFNLVIDSSKYPDEELCDSVIRIRDLVRALESYVNRLEDIV